MRLCPGLPTWNSAPTQAASVRPFSDRLASDHLLPLSLNGHSPPRGYKPGCVQSCQRRMLADCWLQGPFHRPFRSAICVDLERLYSLKMCPIGMNGVQFCL